MGDYNNVLVHATWAVPLDDEERKSRLCVGIDVAMETVSDDTFSDYFYCTSVPGTCGLSFVTVSLIVTNRLKLNAKIVSITVVHQLYLCQY